MSLGILGYVLSIIKYIIMTKWSWLVRTAPCSTTQSVVISGFDNRLLCNRKWFSYRYRSAMKKMWAAQDLTSAMLGQMPQMLRSGPGWRNSWVSLVGGVFVAYFTGRMGCETGTNSWSHQRLARRPFGAPIVLLRFAGKNAVWRGFFSNDRSLFLNDDL